MKNVVRVPRRSTYLDLADALQRFIEQGTLRPGQRVPSVRQTARQHGVSAATVVKAYAQLENRGLLDARPQSGFYVRALDTVIHPEPGIAKPVTEASYVGVSDLATRVMTLSTDADYVAFGSACPDASLFPNKKLARLLGAAARDDPMSLGRYALNWAYEPLTREISRRYLQAGVMLTHDSFLITLGCTEALNLSLRAVTRPGDTVALETPAYFGFLQIIQSLGLKVWEIPADPREGMSLDALRVALGRGAVQAVLVMPTYQNPMGSTMSDEKKARLYELLTEFDTPAVEDDIYGDLYFGAHRAKPLKAYDTDGRVLLCSSFGKTLAPSLRIGWCAPGRYLEPVRRLKLANTMGTPVVLQKTICDFLRTGGYDHHLRSIRTAYRNQLDLFSSTVRRTFPAGTRLSRPEGGFILWVEMPVGVDAVQLHEEAIRRHINFAPGPAFTVKNRYTNCLRLNCGIPWSDKVEQSLATIGQLAAAQLKKRGAG